MAIENSLPCHILPRALLHMWQADKRREVVSGNAPPVGPVNRYDRGAIDVVGPVCKHS